MTLNRKVLLFVLIVAICSINFIACSYSFTGASVPSHLKTVSVPLFNDRTGSGEFDLSEKLTNTLIQRFIEDNTLTIGDKLKSDSIVEGTLVSLSDAPAVVSGGERVSENITSRRITLTVRVVYRDLIKRQTIFERNYSNYADYPVGGGGDITTVRRQAIEKAIEYIAEDILLGVVSNW
ncbi:MAG: LptE family protein [Melioribacteraceae bacterium]|jgi:hypothetical protein|nr:LptE family protein [Melioribacteraceae bacterium]